MKWGNRKAGIGAHGQAWMNCRGRGGECPGENCPEGIVMYPLGTHELTIHVQCLYTRFMYSMIVFVKKMNT